MDWILTFDTANNYTVRDDTGFVVGSGTVNSDFPATNPTTGGNYFHIRNSFFGGVFTGGGLGVGDTIDFSTHPAAVALWYRRDVPSGANSLSGNSVIVAIDGESS
jgi:hypothetical protein